MCYYIGKNYGSSGSNEGDNGEQNRKYRTGLNPGSCLFKGSWNGYNILDKKGNNKYENTPYYPSYQATKRVDKDILKV